MAELGQEVGTRGREASVCVCEQGGEEGCDVRGEKGDGVERVSVDTGEGCEGVWL